MQKIRVYTTTYCPYCEMAKRLLKKQDLPFEEIGLDGQDELRNKLSQENGGWRTVPMIFIGDDFVGGFDQLAALDRAGELSKRVNK